MDETTLTARLPQPVAARVQSLKWTDGRVTAILDGSGLGAAERDALETAVKDVLGAAPDVAEVRVAIMADKPVRSGPVIVAVGSGKGGVGKSTLTANLAVALARSGRKVGLVDADVYGPSQPTLLDTEGQRPQAENDKLIPIDSRFGVKMLSMGHLVEPGKALAWRGPMASGAFGQLVDAHWGDTEVLLLDLPPGTGDVQITMLQKHKPAGAVIVSTPQDLALIDAQRAAELFGKGAVPIIGLVENMSGYVCPHCGESSDPFGSGGVEDAAAEAGLPFLGRIPLSLAVREASDAGTPPAAGDGEGADAFHAIAARLGQWLDQRAGPGSA
ncbi:Mrp/NBP35 family ATP-binding protein [Altererythrobacter sp. TH136]|uniref:Mrp/NBP35 family ATP-binding protein n=1 Tax=Altererythrobacter sp. TH136 TaxID=2067415 RepID=UPI0011654E03|nr:Mrp/NBP35 family ATP-binding protein [Altererythrobacter sp. TH136]QDM41296.1 Mrp/NBP35 family ATP-binding protein [Altererythrobacter sp. TH136]